MSDIAQTRQLVPRGNSSISTNRATQWENPASAGPASAITPSFIWYVFCRWGKLAIPLGLLTMALGIGLVLYLFEPQYRAEALLQIKKQRPMVAIPIDRGESDEFVETQKQLLRSPMVLTRVLAKPEIARMPELRREEDPKKWLEKRLEVKSIGRSELIGVGYQGPNPENAKTIVDGVVNAYLSLQESDTRKQVGSLLEALEKVKQEQVANVKVLEDKVQKLAKQYSGDSAIIVKPNGQSLFELSPAVLGLQQRLTETEFNRQMAAIQIKAFEEGGPRPVVPLPQAELDKLIAAAPQVVDLKKQIFVTDRGLKLLKKDSAYYAKAEKSLHELETQLEETRQQVREALIEEYKNNALAGASDELARIKALHGEYQVQETALRNRLDEERRKIESQTGNQYQLEFLTNDLARAKQVADKIEDRMFALRIEYLSDNRPEQVLPRYFADVPRAPVEEFPLKSTAMAGLLGLFFPFAAFGIYELLSRRLYQSRQLQDHTRLNLIGEVAALPSRPLLSFGSANRRYLKYRAIFEESIESLRSVLTVSPEWANVRVLAVTSAVAREGKTSIASQLATGWARHSDSRTLIIDGDVRDPDIHGIFGIERSPGLAEVLRGDCEQDSAIVRWEERLDILPAGILMAHPHRLFAGSDFAELIQRLRDRYDRIVIDLAPILPASEVLTMLKSVDGVLLCARKDHSRADQIRRAGERLQQAGIQSVGAVFGGLPCTSYAYQYGDYIA
jgi:capsular exopolysaccharide synthesis family protein